MAGCSDVFRISRIFQLVFRHVTSKNTNFCMYVCSYPTDHEKHLLQLRRGAALTEAAVRGADGHVTWRQRADIHRLIEKRKTIIVRKGGGGGGCVGFTASWMVSDNKQNKDSLTVDSIDPSVR